MPNRSTLDNFEPKHLREANEKLDRHVLSANAHKKVNDAYKKDIFKESLWSRIKGFFIN